MAVMGLTAGLASQAQADGLQLSGGVDARARAGDLYEEEVILQGLFLNGRHVLRDDAGDRWIVVVQADAEDNLQHIRPYQVYAQYKGPLGKWNLRAGHFLLPFGLLADYDTERLVLRGVEEENLGLRLDTGVEALGYVGAWDWASSVSSGIGQRWFDEWDGQYAAVARIARAGEEVGVGVSGFLAEVLREDTAGSVSEQRMALDLTWESGRWTRRLEASGGWDDNEGVATGLVLASYALKGWADIDARYSLISRASPEHSLGIGASFKLGGGWIMRPVMMESHTEGVWSDGYVLQLYYDFAKTL